MYGKMIGYKKKSPLSKQHQFSLEEQHQESLQSDLRNAEAARRRYRNTAAEAAKASEKATEQELARLEEVSERERRYANADAQHLEPMGAQAVAMKRKERKGQMFPAVKLGHRGLGNPMMNSESNQVSQALSDLRKKLKARHVTAGQLFRMMDADRSNNLTKEEFQRGLAMSGVRPVPPLEDCEALFDSLDVDKSRGISFQELQGVLEGGGLPAPTSLDLTKAKGRLPVPKPAPIQTKANYSMDRPGSPGWEIRGGARNSNFVPKETPAPGGGWAVKAQKPR